MTLWGFFFPFTAVVWAPAFAGVTIRGRAFVRSGLAFGFGRFFRFRGFRFGLGRFRFLGLGLLLRGRLRPPRRGGEQTGDRLDELHHRDRLGDIAFGAGVADALLVAFGRIGRHRHDRNRPQFGVGLDLLDQLEAADMGHLDVHHDEVGGEGAGALDRLAAVADRLRFVAMGAEQVAEQLQIELVVLDNQYFLSHARTVSDEAGTDK